MQNTARQLDGIEFDRVLEDEISGGTRERTEPAAMLEYRRVTPITSPFIGAAGRSG